MLLNGTGGAFYTWLPATFLSNPLIFNPIASLQNNQTYILRVADSLGCFALDTINITVFQTAPDIFVPTIFTPNNDNKNDILIPVPVGMKSIDFFEVYNRWGQLVFRTTQIGMGWNGNFLGTPQGIATFVWKVQGTDYTGKRIFKKGTVVLAK